ncbi:unnamed protein product [Closterium sp. NIES-53]
MTTFRPVEEFVSEYKMHEELGTGRFGRITRCTHRATGKEFACKRVAGQPDALRAAANEIRALTIMDGCQHVVSFHAVFRNPKSNTLYIILDFATNGDLQGLVHANGALPEWEARRLFRDLAQGVKECHDRSVMHRDIKPDNVLLFSQTVAKLADFGSSVVVKPWQRTQGFVGSLPYAAPEVLAGKNYSFPADVWSLGATLFAILSCRWPTVINGRHSSREWEMSCWISVSHRAKNLIGRMLSADANRRPTVDEVLADPWLCSYSGQRLSREGPGQATGVGSGSGLGAGSGRDLREEVKAGSGARLTVGSDADFGSGPGTGSATGWEQSLPSGWAAGSARGLRPVAGASVRRGYARAGVVSRLPVAARGQTRRFYRSNNGLAGSAAAGNAAGSAAGGAAAMAGVEVRRVRATTGLFGYEELSEPKGFHRMAANAIARTEALLQEVAAAPPSLRTVCLLDEMSDTVRAPALCIAFRGTFELHRIDPSSPHPSTSYSICLLL